MVEINILAMDPLLSFVNIANGHREPDMFRA